MSVSISGRYVGNKKVELTHGPSTVTITTAAPKDNNGDGSSFSPTDLVAGALGACMLTLMDIVAERDKVDLSGTYFSLEKHMLASPRRIEKVPVVFHLPKSVPEDKRDKLKNAAMTCPVFRTLNPEVQVDVVFHYDVP